MIQKAEQPALQPLKFQATVVFYAYFPVTALDEVLRVLSMMSIVFEACACCLNKKSFEFRPDFGGECFQNDKTKEWLYTLSVVSRRFFTFSGDHLLFGRV